VRESNELTRQSPKTFLTNRDRDIFLKMLDDVDARPNNALLAAARKYLRRMSSLKSGRRSDNDPLSDVREGF